MPLKTRFLFEESVTRIGSPCFKSQRLKRLRKKSSCCHPGNARDLLFRCAPEKQIRRANPALGNDNVSSFSAACKAAFIYQSYGTLKPCPAKPSKPL
jgi:hypothetical protein